MKIGTCVNFSEFDGMEKKFAQLREHNFDSCQLVSWNPAAWTDENANTLKTLLEQYQITVSAFWCGWTGPAAWNFYDGQLTLGLVPVEYRQMRIENLCDGADFAHKLGITDVVTHMGLKILLLTWDLFRKILMIPISAASASLCALLQSI